MGLRFRKSLKIAPGIKLNLNKKSASVTFGGKGLHHTVSTSGKKTSTVGVPGTGISYSTASSGSGKAKNKSVSTGASSDTKTQPGSPESPDKEKWYKKTGWIITFLIFLFPLGCFLMWKYKDWEKNKKIILTVIFALFFIFILFVGSGSDNDNKQKHMDEISTELESSNIETDFEQTETAEEPTTVTETAIPETTVPETAAPTTVPETIAATPSTEYVQKVWINDTGEKYHIRSNCSNIKNAYQVTIDQAIALGKQPCAKCY